MSGNSSPLPVVTIRRGPSTPDGTFGALTIANASPIYMQTMELPWHGNAHEVSSIPPGTYNCRMTHSPRFGRDTYEVYDVPNRNDIRIHSANFAGDVALGKKCELNGCIALGSSVGPIEGQRALLQSRKAVEAFETYLGGAPFTLVVI